MSFQIGDQVENLRPLDFGPFPHQVIPQKTKGKVVDINEHSVYVDFGVKAITIGFGRNGDGRCVDELEAVASDTL